MIDTNNRHTETEIFTDHTGFGKITDSGHAAVIEKTLEMEKKQKRGMHTQEKCVIYFRLCTGVLIKMSNERVIRAAPQRLQTSAYLYTYSTRHAYMQTQNTKKENH